MKPTVDPDAWDRVADLYERARAQLPENLSAFLADEEGRDPAAASEVRQMLASDSSPAFRELESELGARQTEPAHLGSLRGADIGPYKLGDLIGRGGMGDVYLAERRDDGFAQRLAVKVLRSQLISRSSVDRFDRERRIQATLSHPSILALIDTGMTPDGHPFLVLPHVEGIPITRFADQNRLSIPDRLKPFIEVCRAVQYAHSRFVVHRDIKPSNILVLADGSVRLLDFGIAKLISDGAIEGGEETRELVAPMTPERAAPEQLRGEPISTAADVWGLGVLLFELLTGRLPIVGAGREPAEIERKITQEGIPDLWTAVEASGGALGLAEARSMSASQIQRWLRGDLAMVVAKSLHVDPRMRYASAADLAADLENVIAQRPVTARPDTAWYRIRRAASRRPALASAFVVGVVAFATVATVASLSARRIAAERDRATAEEGRARSVVSLLVDLFGATAPAPGNDPRTVSIDALLTQGESRVAALGDQPEAQGEMYATLARIRMERSEFAASRSLFERSLERYRSAGTPPEAPGRTAAVFGFATLLQQMDAPADAVPMLEELKKSLPSRSKDYARALQSLGASKTGPEAVTLVLEAVALLRELGASPIEIADAQNALASLHFLSRRTADAYAIWKEIVPVLERDLGPDHPDTLRVLNNLATSSPDLRDSIAAHRRLIQSHERLLGAKSAPLSNDWNNLGVAMATARDYEGADAALRTSLEMRREVLGGTHKQTISTWRNVARVAELRGRLDEALREFLAVDQLFTRPDTQAERAAIAVQRAQVLLRLGRTGEARRIAENSLVIARKAGPAEALNETNALLLLGKMALARGDLANATKLLRETMTRRESLVGPANPRRAEARAELGRALVASGDPTGRAMIVEALPALQAWGVFHMDDLKALEAAVESRRQ